MDTKFWGPSGWELLHIVAYTYPKYPSQSTKNKYKRFFLILDKILPCKYCRDSLHQFYKELPIKHYLDNRHKLTQWIYQIHNKVNDKLRKQKLLTTPNPSKTEIDRKFKEFTENITGKSKTKTNIKIKQNFNKNGCCPQCFGWKFIYSIAFNYPKTKQNILTNPKKKNIYIKFFNYLGDVIACDRTKIHYKSYIKENNISDNLENRSSLTKWLYGLECSANSTNINLANYNKVCSKYNKVRVKSCKKTCRKEDTTASIIRNMRYGIASTKTKKKI
jgi:hypothetical protein